MAAVLTHSGILSIALVACMNFDVMFSSQSNEDAIIADIFAEIGVTNKRFIEFGCGHGGQNNTIELLRNGWSGIWLDCDRRRTDRAKELYVKWPVEIRCELVTPENINEIVTDPLDFLSIDIDGNDYAVWQAVKAKPRVVCIEYDAIHGSTLERIRELGVRKGYRLVRCSASNVNAFFVLHTKTLSGRI